MLITELQHPTILRVLGESGHGSGILIADGNYPFGTRANPNAERVYLNLKPGVVNALDVLDALLTAIPIEEAHVMMTDDGTEPSIHTDYRERLPGIELVQTERWSFYEKCKAPDVSLVIATAEERTYANLLLIVGVVEASDRE